MHPNSFTGERLNERLILTFRIDDDHIIVRASEDNLGHLRLCRDSLTRTRSTQNEAIAVLCRRPISHQRVR